MTAECSSTTRNYCISNSQCNGDLHLQQKASCPSNLQLSEPKQNGKIIAKVRGPNGPLLIRKTIELVQEEREIAAGGKEHAEVVETTLEEEPSEESIEEDLAKAEVTRYSVGIIKPYAVLEGRVEEIKQKIKNGGLGVEAAEESMLTEEQIRVFYAQNKEQSDFEDFVQFMMSGPCHVLASLKKKQQMLFLTGKKLCQLYLCEPNKSEAEKPNKLETESVLNLCDVEDRIEDASRQLAFFFRNFAKMHTDQKIARTLALIRPSLLKEKRDSVLGRIKAAGFEIAMQKEIILSQEQIHDFYKEHENQDYFPVLLEQMTSGPTLALALSQENAIAHWRDLLGTKTVEEAKKENPDSLHAKYAVENISIGQLHGSSTPDDPQKELESFFPQEQPLALIKPAAAKKHKGDFLVIPLDDIMQKIKDAGFNISNITEKSLTHEMAAQFYAHHNGKPFFEDLLNCMTEGPSVIMVLTKENAVEEWRQLIGSTDPAIAKQISPESVRAQFAEDTLRNAVHGSSDREHALKSIKYLFGEIDID
ncbi:thioredoxin domain-containing protein 3 [Phaenicophaeus curvirostris]|uniref:thioredoxin domain-containing protein 3 n=1 Tax=Phaenicophaeus curvirostris TaxID=33595 RepID=UPI0037F0EA5A